jgi:hypothetical protein
MEQGPNWAGQLQALGSVGAVVALVGIGFVWWQIRQVHISIQSNTSERLTAQSLEILRFLAEHPETYDYFYNGKEPPLEANNVLNYATEMLVNYMEHVVAQREAIPKHARDNWDRFVEDTYARSPIVREYLTKFREWYDPRLLEMVTAVKVPSK